MDTEQRDIVELLADYSGEYAQARGDPVGIREDGLPNDAELHSLLRVARQVKYALQPVPMPMGAKRRLRANILESTRLARSRDVVIEPIPSNRGLVIGAAVALAGGIAYLIHARTRAD